MMERMSEKPPRSVAVIGLGISGLSAAYRLQQLRPELDLRLYDSRERLGGVIDTVQREGFLVERSADMFTTREPWALELCEQLGMSDELIGTNSEFRRAFVIQRGKLIEVPPGFTLMSPAKIWPVIKTPLLSWSGKLRMASEYFRGGKQDDADESLQSFAVRRFGQQAFERLIQPLIGGIYTADPEKLSMAATMAQFVEMEREHGSLIRGMRAKAARESSNGESSGARYGMFVSPKHGLSQLVQRLEQELSKATIKTGCSIQSLVRNEEGWQVCGEGFSDQVDALVLAIPSFVAAGLLKDTDGSLASQLKEIPYASAALLALAYERRQIAHPLDGFGFVAPQIENRRILAGSFSSVKFSGRAPDDQVLIRVFVGGALQGELVDLDDAQLEELVVGELGELLSIQGQPQWIDISRWRNAMPQYHVGHLDRVAAIERRVDEYHNLALAGNAYRGVGIPFCVHSGFQAAESLV